MTRATDKMALLREAVEQILLREARPMTTPEIESAPEIMALDLPMYSTSNMMFRLWNRKRRPFPLGRISAATGSPKWAYYHKDVCAPLTVQRKADTEVNDVNEPVDADALENLSDDFQFNPVELGEMVQPPQAQDMQVHAHPGVKGITLTIAGVTIRIDMAS